MKGSLEKKVAVITGGNSGIGKAVSEELARKGTKVVIAGRNTKRGDSVVRTITDGGGEAKFVKMDVRNETDVRLLFEKTLTTFGRLDYLFNNAGIESGVIGPITECPETVCDDVLSTNIKGVILCLKHSIPAMLENGGGVIVNNASFAGTTMYFPNGVVYGASKAAVLSITSSVALGFAKQGIRVFAVCPWATDTPMLNRMASNQTDLKDKFAKINPSGRLVTPQEISDVVIAMFEKSSRFINGDPVLVDSSRQTQQVPISLAS
ncbi:MAG: SDR family oxidoreductase [Chloroflexi bacterium]|nr:SDR family oxidoreductase [Chloroflexota bacterium]